MTRQRTNKTVAARLRVDLFPPSDGIRRWSKVLAFLATVAATAWVVGSYAMGVRLPFASGTVSLRHAMFRDDCEKCHTPWRPASEMDGACKTCHDGPIHQAEEARTPHCAECHDEHKGHVRLAAVTDAHCTQCHANLTTKSGRKPLAQTTVTSFAGDHPEFALF